MQEALDGRPQMLLLLRELYMTRNLNGQGIIDGRMGTLSIKTRHPTPYPTAAPVAAEAPVQRPYAQGYGGLQPGIHEYAQRRGTVDFRTQQYGSGVQRHGSLDIQPTVYNPGELGVQPRLSGVSGVAPGGHRPGFLRKTASMDFGTGGLNHSGRNTPVPAAASAHRGPTQYINLGGTPVPQARGPSFHPHQPSIFKNPQLAKYLIPTPTPGTVPGNSTAQRGAAIVPIPQTSAIPYHQAVGVQNPVSFTNPFGASQQQQQHNKRAADAGDLSPKSPPPAKKKRAGKKETKKEMEAQKKAEDEARLREENKTVPEGCPPVGTPEFYEFMAEYTGE
jgi:hypothetical protein